ncbi:CIA30-domain-containing protein [Cryphonectria parasitica EP155]|uniref:CIA30-domain-containing protein n=1 Tax=Cryphonectria parasitica (strain ATCC 38755 / EP155) TaxID=660469 RepID=A0A9P4XUW8_CRYP1|nr:CIA30-domain-containing protein [Cryphonectria parasitica EP155]KAF3761443.1 CIA30-domain-containing protein [Cryphonectria parasitica EP155]
MYLFGGDRPWDASQFTASDDRVRGGRSQSYLTVLGPGGSADAGLGAEYHGTLDIKTLGGAGFASQRTVDGFPALDLSAYDALVLDVTRADGQKYTITLKDEVLPKRPDGREQSTVSWEYDFDSAAGEAGSNGDSACQLVIPFEDFKPTYRGKAKPDAKPLDLKNVRRISFMMRSFFGEQEGDFSIIFTSVSVRKGNRSQDSSRDRDAGGAGLSEPRPDAVGGSSNSSDGSDKSKGLMSWISSVLGWDR